MNRSLGRFGVNEFERVSMERKDSISHGDTPKWYTTQGYMLFKKKYAAHKDETVKERMRSVSDSLATAFGNMMMQTLDQASEARSTELHGLTHEAVSDKFFDLMWSGKLAPSTPVLCNVGTGRGHPVSCSGGKIKDSIGGFYDSAKENALLSKNGYGTSSYLGGIRSRGSEISSGGIADGVVPVFDTQVDVSNKVSQGQNRRGSWAGYLEADHNDFYELAGYVQKNPADANVGWMISDAFIERLKAGDKDSIDRFNRIMYLRARTGKGYIWKHDTANRLAPQAVKNSGISIKASNLCSEIALPQDDEHTFSCVLSSINLTKWDEITSEDVFWMITFLDCVVEVMLMQTYNQEGFENIHRFTEKARALGLGTLGFHSYLQEKMLPFDCLEAQVINSTIFKTLKEWGTTATQRLATVFGEPEWCKGTGQRNATLFAVAPNTSSALLCGGVSQGIEPVVANAFNQGTAGGEMTRINPYLAKLAKERGVYSDDVMRGIAVDHNGSVQHVDWLTDEEKEVFRTAFEIDQMSLVKMASERQKYIDQGQSLNLFFNTDEGYIARVTKAALLDPYIKALYYQRSLRGVKASTGECVACEG
jgi:ribonucleoside-diphosphate reductase alpha chain